jgi:hypothetical protein
MATGVKAEQGLIADGAHGIKNRLVPGGASDCLQSMSLQAATLQCPQAPVEMTSVPPSKARAGQCGNGHGDN